MSEPPEPDDDRTDPGVLDDELLDDDDDELLDERLVGPGEVGQRLDRFLAAIDALPTRSQLKRAIERGEVTVNGLAVKAGYVLRAGDRVQVALAPPPRPEGLVAEPIPLEILFEDDALLVLDKPAGLVVHPAPGHPRGTLVNALLHHCGAALQAVGASGRPGLVHRLDRDTSGVMVVAKTLASHAALARQFAAHSIDRAYLALCLGGALPDAQLTLDTLHGRHPTDRKRFTGRVQRGRRAVTRVEVLERFADGAALVRCTLETGRTHQIRVHLSEAHAPILGDAVYGGRGAGRSRLVGRVALHAARLGFDHPVGGERLVFERPLPADLAEALERLRRGASWR